MRPFSHSMCQSLQLGKQTVNLEGLSFILNQEPKPYDILHLSKYFAGNFLKVKRIKDLEYVKYVESGPH